MGLLDALFGRGRSAPLNRPSYDEHHQPPHDEHGRPLHDEHGRPIQYDHHGQPIHHDESRRSRRYQEHDDDE